MAKSHDVSWAYQALKNEISRVVVGQDTLLQSLCVGLFSSGHVLLEGVPGLAKTLVAESLAQALDLSHVRVQFTPDLLPSDIIGTETYRPQTGEFFIKSGPISTNVLVADEINRAPSKVQSALLEAMQERQVTIAGVTTSLPDPFFVVATMNPLEEEWTYPLPEASLDRFLLKIQVEYPNRSNEIEIMKRMGSSNLPKISKVLSKKDILAIQKTIEDEVFVDDKIYSYVADIVSATRNPEEYGFSKITPLIAYGVSPRASIGLVRSAKALAAISGRDYVVPEDIKACAFEVLRHRIGLSFQALSQGILADSVITMILSEIPVP